jgi:ABC-type multidrug transport system ATPase subunit
MTQPAHHFAARGLRRSIPGRTLFEDVQLELVEGEVLAVRGASGAGKTQLLRQLAGLDPLEAGELRLDGRTPDEWGAQAWRAEVQYVPQVAPPMAGTPREFAASLARLRVQRKREAGDPLELASGWGLSATEWDKEWRSLSVGERQRALLAILLARRPSVLLLDEPTASLDPGSVEAVEQSLAASTCVWVTHHPEQAARMATRVLTLGGGAGA